MQSPTETIWVIQGGIETYKGNYQPNFTNITQGSMQGPTETIWVIQGGIETLKGNSKPYCTNIT